MAFPGKRSDTIQSGTSASNGIDVDGFQPTSLILSGTYDNTTFDIQASFDDGSTWFDIFDVSGNKINISVADGKHSFPEDSFRDVTHVRVNGSSNETSERSIEWLISNL